MIVKDITSENFYTLLEQNDETLAVISSESGAVLSNWLGRYNKAQQTEEHVLLAGFSGESETINRQGREPVHLANACISVLMTLTPDQLRMLFKKGRFREGGLLPRFLASPREWPLQLDDGRRRVPDNGIATKWARLITAAIDGRKTPVTVEITPEALEVFRAFHNETILTNAPVMIP